MGLDLSGQLRSTDFFAGIFFLEVKLLFFNAVLLAGSIFAQKMLQVYFYPFIYGVYLYIL